MRHIFSSIAIGIIISSFILHWLYFRPLQTDPIVWHFGGLLVLIIISINLLTIGFFWNK